MLDREYHVFASEPRLYSGNQNVNNRLHKNYLVVREYLYSCNEINDEVLEMMKAAAISMADKLQAYQCDKLLGGELWNPSEKVKSLLANLEPTNDVQIDIGA